MLLSTLTLSLIFVPANHRELSLSSSAWKSLEKAVVYKVATTQQTPGPVKRVQLQLSGSNPQPTTQRQEARDEINSPVYLKYIVTITFVGPFPKELLTPKDHGVFWDEK